MSTPVDSDRPPLRVTGICNRCEQRTNDGVLRIVEQGIRRGQPAVSCADLTACDSKRLTSRR